MPMKAPEPFKQADNTLLIPPPATRITPSGGRSSPSGGLGKVGRNSIDPSLGVPNGGPGRLSRNTDSSAEARSLSDPRRS